MQLQLDKIRGLTNPWYNVECKPCQKCLSLHLLVTFLIHYNVFFFFFPSLSLVQVAFIEACTKKSSTK